MDGVVRGHQQVPLDLALAQKSIWTRLGPNSLVPKEISSSGADADHVESHSCFAHFSDPQAVAPGTPSLPSQ